MNGTEFPDIPPVRLAPLGVYAEMSHDNFLQVDVDGHLVNVDASNAIDTPSATGPATSSDEAGKVAQRASPAPCSRPFPLSSSATTRTFPRNTPPTSK